MKYFYLVICLANTLLGCSASAIKTPNATHMNNTNLISNIDMYDNYMVNLLVMGMTGIFTIVQLGIQARCTFFKERNATFFLFLIIELISFINLGYAAILGRNVSLLQAQLIFGLIFLFLLWILDMSNRILYIFWIFQFVPALCFYVFKIKYYFENFDRLADMMRTSVVMQVTFILDILSNLYLWCMYITLYHNMAGLGVVHRASSANAVQT